MIGSMQPCAETSDWPAVMVEPTNVDMAHGNLTLQPNYTTAIKYEWCFPMFSLAKPDSDSNSCGFMWYFKKLSARTIQNGIGQYVEYHDTPCLYSGHASWSWNWRIGNRQSQTNLPKFTKWLWVYQCISSCFDFKQCWTSKQYEVIFESIVILENSKKSSLRQRFFPQRTG